jgi:hypothetical protein
MELSGYASGVRIPYDALLTTTYSPSLSVDSIDTDDTR